MPPPDLSRVVLGPFVALGGYPIGLGVSLIVNTVGFGEGVGPGPVAAVLGCPVSLGIGFPVGLLAGTVGAPSVLEFQPANIQKKESNELCWLFRCPLP